MTSTYQSIDRLLRKSVKIIFNIACSLVSVVDVAEMGAMIQNYGYIPDFCFEIGDMYYWLGGFGKTHREPQTFFQWSIEKIPIRLEGRIESITYFDRDYANNRRLATID